MTSVHETKRPTYSFAELGVEAFFTAIRINTRIFATLAPYMPKSVEDTLGPAFATAARLNDITARVCQNAHRAAARNARTFAPR